jgi:hypothetical protein
MISSSACSSTVTSLARMSKIREIPNSNITRFYYANMGNVSNSPFSKVAVSP